MWRGGWIIRSAFLSDIERLPATLIQAQCDYLGANTYERLDKPRGEFFHTNWISSGGNVSMGTYNV